MSKDKDCPFCGSGVLYEVYHNVDGFDMPFMFCNSCKAMFTVEASEDWVTGDRDGMDELRAHWNRRVEPHYATVRLPEETQRRIEQMVRETVTEQLAENGIVRCRDCKNSIMDGTRCTWWASYQPILGGREHQLKPADVDPYNFCAWGERRDA
jgi:DNA-directed RNA polymerase subunit M/transcription elongation factor TFIIS